MEVGALMNNYPIEAMRSSQMNIVNRTGILISTAYESLNNPMVQEVEVAEKVIRGLLKDDSLFALLYRPDYPKEWMTSDDELLKANPLAAEVTDNIEFLKKNRDAAIEIPDKRKNFLTKHMNIFVNGDEVEAFIGQDDLEACEVDEVDWTGRDVYVGFDLSASDDNTGVSMSSYDFQTGKFIAKSWAFYPKGKEAEKSRVEKLNYEAMTEKGYAIPSGGQIIDYVQIEDFIMSLEDKYQVNILAVGYDKWNAAPTVSRLSALDMTMIETPQKMLSLYPPTKMLKEAILTENFQYEKNDLLKLNFLNAKMVTDTNLSYFLNKKKSTGKIDMVASLINSLYLWEQDIIDGDNDRDRMVTIF